MIRALNESVGCHTARTSKSDNQSKEEDKDQELIQSSTTPDPGHHMVK